MSAADAPPLPPAVKLTAGQRDFLERVRDGHRLRLADRVEDRIRQAMRRARFVEVLAKPRRWSITDAGRAALDADRG